jgi:hypothetical protein
MRREPNYKFKTRFNFLYSFVLHLCMAAVLASQDEARPLADPSS